MDDLFEQLKKAPAVNKNIKAPPTRKFLSPTPSDDFEINVSAKSSRRESLPSHSASSILMKLNSHKSRSLSPPKHSVKPFKVLVERKKFEDIMKKNKEKQKKSSKSASKTIADAYRDLFKKPPIPDKTDKSPIKAFTSAKEHKTDKIDKPVKSKAEKSVKSPTKEEKPVKSDKSIKSPTKIEKALKVDKSIKGDKYPKMNKLSEVDKSIKPPNKGEKPIKIVDKLINSPTKVDKTIKVDKTSKVDKTLKMDKIEKGDKTPSPKKPSLNSSTSSSSSNSNSSPKKLTPTKAQKKQFAPCDVIPLYASCNFQQGPGKQKRSYKIKRCVVRLPRQNLKKLQKKFLKLNLKSGKIPGPKSSTSEAIKRKSSDKNSPSPPKRAKESNKKEPTGFFIKLSSPSTMKGQNKKQLTKKTDLKHRLILNHKSSKPGSSFNNYKSSSSTTKPTKFTRTQLIKAFGKRFFKSHVKIEKCNHPLMLIFESNARARKLQTKRNKSKNLSVSFKDQVEIFGCTDSEDYDSSDSDSDVPYTPKITSVRKASSFNAATNKSVNSSASLTPLPATPARLKKVENGKVIDDIELDPALFLDPSVVASGITSNSTPYGHSSGRKKREKKSFSPLKGDATSSPRKEQFKLANEKMPPSGLRRLNIDDVDDEDDEDDDCEYIVPIDIPHRRASHSNSNNTAESSSSFVSAIDFPITNSAGSPTALDKSNEIEADAAALDDLRLDAPTPDDLELDAPTPEGIDLMACADDEIPSRVSLTGNKKGGAEKDAVSNIDNIPIFTPILNECAATPPMNENTSAEKAAKQQSVPALAVSKASEELNDRDNAVAQNLDEDDESNINSKGDNTSANEKDDVDELNKQLKANTVVSRNINGSGKNDSVAADGNNAVNEQDISLTMFVEGDEDIIENILKERIDEIVKDVDMNDSSSPDDAGTTAKESNNVEALTKTVSPSNAIEE